MNAFFRFNQGLLKQPLNSPMPVEEQVVLIYAGTSGYLDDVPVEDVVRFERELLDHVRSVHGGLLDEVRNSAVPDALAGVVESFKTQFQSSALEAGHAVDPTHLDVDEMGDAHSAKTLATE